MPIKIWKTRPVNFVLLEILRKRGAMTDDELFEELTEEFSDLGFRDFNRLLMCLEIVGKVRVTAMARGKRRVEILT